MSSCGKIFHYFAGDDDDETGDNLVSDYKSGVSGNELSDAKAAPAVSGSWYETWLIYYMCIANCIKNTLFIYCKMIWYNYIL